MDIYTYRLRVEKHIAQVQAYMQEMIMELISRAMVHDESKLHEPELSVYAELTDKLVGIPYHTPEHYRIMSTGQEAIDHHFKYNPHHPEHTSYGIEGMTLLDLVEMLCDMKAASMRGPGDTGSIQKSIDIQQEKYGIDPQLTQILRNTAKRWETES